MSERLRRRVKECVEGTSRVKIFSSSDRVRATPVLEGEGMARLLLGVPFGLVYS